MKNQKIEYTGEKGVKVLAARMSVTQLLELHADEATPTVLFNDGGHLHNVRSLKSEAGIFYHDWVQLMHSEEWKEAVTDFVEKRGGEADYETLIHYGVRGIEPPPKPKRQSHAEKTAAMEAEIERLKAEIAALKATK